MSSLDMENQQLAEWLQLLGCPIELSSEDLRKINTINMRSVWRHLRRHVMPVQNVRIIRKNLLLEEVNEKNLHQTRLGNVKIESLYELAHLQNISKVKEELSSVKEKINNIDEQLQSATKSFTTKVAEKQCLKNELSEEEKKISLLNLKLKSCQQDLNNFEQNMDKASFLKTFPSLVMTLEMKDNVTQISSLVNKSSFCENTGYNDDSIYEMVPSLTLQYPASTIFDGMYSAINTALKSLRNRIDLDISVNFGVSRFSKHLTLLNEMVLRNEIELFSCVEKLKVDEDQLEKDKTVLLRFVKECFEKNSIDTVEISFEKIIHHIIVQKSLEKTKEIMCNLDSCSYEFHCKKSMIDNLGAKECELLKEVDKKILNINNTIIKVLSSNVSSLKSEIHEKCCEIVSNFLAKLKQSREDHMGIFEASENLIKKEVDIFQKSSLMVLSRKWADALETVPSGLQMDIFKNHDLLCFLLQSEPKNLIKFILEKLRWCDFYKN